MENFTVTIAVPNPAGQRFETIASLLTQHSPVASIAPSPLPDTRRPPRALLPLVQMFDRKGEASLATKEDADHLPYKLPM